MGFWTLVIAIVVNLALSMVILTRATKASSTAYFGISALFISAWALGALLLQFGDSERAVRIGLILFLLAPMATTLYMVLFSKYFSEIASSIKYLATGGFTLFMALFATVTLIWSVGSDVVITINGMAGNELNFQYNWFIFYGLYFVTMFSVAYTYLLFGVIRSQGRTRRLRKVVLMGIFATSFLALGTNVILPMFGYTQLIWLGPAWTIFYIVTTSYAMIKHGLFDLRRAVVLTFTYVLSLAALAILYYILAFTLSVIFIPNSGEAQSFNGIDVAIALLLAFMFQPIRKFFDKFTSNIFYQDSYSVSGFFSDLSRILTNTNDLHSLLKRVSEKISGTLKASSASFTVYNGAGRIEQIGIGKFSRITRKDTDWLDEHLAATNFEPKIVSFLDDDKLRRMMVSHRITVILPLVRQDTKLGYLFLGEHQRSSYSTRDIQVMRTLADELVIAIQNALSVQEVRDLNAGLEQRVTSATKELRRSNAQLQRLDEAKDEFISMASHQLRTPLTSIKGYLSMLIEGDVGEVTPEQKHVLSEAFISSERMVRLISDFLNVSRLQTGKFVIEKQPVDLALLVQHEIDGLKQNAASHNLKFTYTHQKNMPLVQLDENKIQQVVMNFCDNAIYYSKEKGTIEVSLKKTEKYVEFKVVDDGIGIPKAEQADLFNKFYRASNAKRARPDGTGVGLFLTKKVIDEHDGTIIFESKEGEGSTFGFRIPIE